SANGKRLVAGGSSAKDDSNIYVWDIESGTLISDLGDGRRHEVSVALDPDGQYVFSGTREGIVEVHTVQSGNSHIVGGRAQLMVGLALSPDDKRLATTGGATNIVEG